MPSEKVSPQKQQELDVEFSFTPEDWLHFDRNVAALHKQYLSLGLPTPFEDPNRYAVMAMIFDGMQQELRRKGQFLKPRLFLATLPSGDVNATISIEPDTGAPVIFFEQGLFQFFYDFVLLVGWAVPPLSPQHLSDDMTLTQLRRRYTMPLHASEFFAATLYAYVVAGTPILAPSPLPRPTHNLLICMVLLAQMERFAMVHEMAHLTLGHLNESPKWDHEHDADAAGLALVSKLAHENLGSWGVGFWACDLVLTSFNFLYRAIGLMKFGPRKLKWISKTHPDPLSRRSRLREMAAGITPNVPKIGLAAAGELCGMTDALFQRLWEISSAGLLMLYQKGARPSPVWNKWIKHNITAQD
jgi:hypothetical protein